MNKYEVMYIVRPDLSEEARKTVIDSFAKIFTDRKAEVLNVEGFGMRDLAYEIQKHTKGFYVVFKTECDAETVSEFERLARISEDIIRFLVVSDYVA